MQKSMMKYITSIGQNTGTLKASKNVQIMAMMMPFVAECLQKRVSSVKTVEPFIKRVYSQHLAALLPRSNLKYTQTYDILKAQQVHQCGKNTT